MIIPIVEVKPHIFKRAGFEVTSWLNFGPHYDSRHELDLSIVKWRLPTGEQLNESSHPNTDIISLVLNGQYRQDNSIAENIQLKTGDAFQLCNSEKGFTHRDSNSGEETLELLQIYIKQINEVTDAQKIELPLKYKYEIHLLKDQELNIQTQDKTVLIVNIGDKDIQYIVDKIEYKLQTLKLRYFQNTKHEVIFKEGLIIIY